MFKNDHRGLALHLGPDRASAFESDAPVNSFAYEYYLRGVDLYATSNFSAAIAMLEKSAALEPNYAPAWAYLGRAYTTNGLCGLAAAIITIEPKRLTKRQSS